MLEGHEELVRCIRFDSKRIVSGAYDGKIKVWDLVAALDPRAPATSLCLKTLEVIIIFSIVIIRDFIENQQLFTFTLLIKRNIRDECFVYNLMNSKL